MITLSLFTQNFIRVGEEVNCQLSCRFMFRGIKEMVGLAYFNPNAFKVLSGRAASSAGANLAATSVADIFNMGSWSNISTCEKFYNKLVLSPELPFQICLLNKSSTI